MKKTALTLMTLSALLLFSGNARAGDAASGKKLFKKCAICHGIGTPKKKKVGPDLQGIVGRKSAAQAGFKYSKALANANLIWDEANLSRFLEAPKKMVPGTRMAFMGLKNKKDRDDLIAFLK